VDEIPIPSTESVDEYGCANTEGGSVPVVFVALPSSSSSSPSSPELELRSSGLILKRDFALLLLRIPSVSAAVQIVYISVLSGFVDA
jgi:hypothetical protein